MRLTRFEDAWAQAALGAIFPDAPGLAGIASMDVSGYLAGALRTLPWKPAFGLRLAIWVVAWSPLFVLRRVSTIVRLGPADRERLVARLCASPSYALRSLVTVLKTFGALLYAGDARVQARLVARSGPRLAPSGGLAGGPSDGQSAVVPLVALRRKRANVA